jgi:hypothetical protein
MSQSGNTRMEKDHSSATCEIPFGELHSTLRTFILSIALFSNDFRNLATSLSRF